ncbi:MAG: phosphatidylglycerophosphatase A [Candidatus Acidiferrales bacterium]
MNAKTEAPPPAAPSTPARRKPRFALFIATVCGLGYIPIAPGTFGSLAGLVLVTLPFFSVVAFTLISGDFTIATSGSRVLDPILLTHIFVAAATAAIGVWSANRAAAFWREKDPQRVVIDEVSGQHLAIVLGCALPVWWKPAQMMWGPGTFGYITMHSALSWKYLLVGFILFRVFDIWKPFPARQAERLPGGWGIMADDWIAGIYAAMGLWLARAFLHL